MRTPHAIKTNNKQLLMILHTQNLRAHLSFPDVLRSPRHKNPAKHIIRNETNSTIRQLQLLPEAVAQKSFTTVCHFP